MDAQRITISMSDQSAGYEASPERVRLAALADFSYEVQVFLRGEGREIDTAQLEVAVVKGSLAIETAPIALAPTLFRDLQLLQSSELLDNLDGKRREIVQKWQKAARGSRQQVFKIAASFLDRPVVIGPSTDFRADDADQWVQVERYVRGEIMDLGGIGKANAHVKLPDGSTLTISTDREVLRADKFNRLYKQAMLRINAQYNVVTQELRDARLIEFVEYAPRFDEDAFARMTKRGAQAWKDVEDASAWVEDQRGGEG